MNPYRRGYPGPPTRQPVFRNAQTNFCDKVRPPMVAPALHEPAAVKAAPAAEAHRSFLGARHFPSLDGLRCLAILPVVWHHSTPRPLPGVLGRGPLGVDLFFAISGFLITTLLLREASTTGRISLSGFYARRRSATGCTCCTSVPSTLRSGWFPTRGGRFGCFCWV